MKMRILLIGVFALAMMSCGTNHKTTGPKSEENTQAQTAAKKEMRQVIFFTPSTDELYEISVRDGEENATMSVIDEFETNAQEFANSNGISNLSTSFVTDKIVVVKLKDGREFRVERDMDSNLCGAIFNNGEKEPLIVKGVRLPLEYSKLAHEFFNVSEQ
ncbi:MAG: hypothetical protein R2809_09005 [Flavobacteriales bacterium]